MWFHCTDIAVVVDDVHCVRHQTQVWVSAGRRVSLCSHYSRPTGPAGVCVEIWLRRKTGLSWCIILNFIGTLLLRVFLHKLTRWLPSLEISVFMFHSKLLCTSFKIPFYCCDFFSVDNVDTYTHLGCCSFHVTGTHTHNRLTAFCPGLPG